MLVAIAELICFFSMIIFILTSNKLKKKSFKQETLDEKKNEKYYCREIPFDDLGLAFYFGIHYGIIDNPSNFFGAMILKWLKEEKIHLIKINNKLAIDMQDLFKKPDNYERDIYIQLLISSGTNHILEEEDFKIFFENNSQYLEKFFQKMITEIEEYLIANKTIEKVLDGYQELNYKYRLNLSAELKEKVKQMQGLKNFLQDFSLIHEKESLQVHLWDNYLIYAELFGIASAVENDLYHLYPHYYQNSSLMQFIYDFTFSVTLPASVLKIIMKS